MDIAAEICAALADEWLPTIYKDKVRTQRTRSYNIEIPVRENRADIQYTLLGIELKVGTRRFACPDLATARYLRVFARIGCRDFAVPYDISRISGIADELETAWQRALVFTEAKFPDNSAARRQLIKTIRSEITAIGAGDIMPQFNRETRVRKTE